MSIALPWWAKIGLKILLSKLPISYMTWQKIGVFKHGSMDMTEYSRRVFQYHIDRVKPSGEVSGKTILELGPGDSIATAVFAAAAGAKAILVDTDRFALDEVALYAKLKDSLPSARLRKIDFFACKNIDDILRVCESRYLTGGLSSMREIESESVDYLFSQAVLEHVRKNEFFAILQECNRILKPTGVCSHQIDLRDHIGGALNNLRFSDRYWESSLFAKSGFYTNRINYKEMLAFFSAAGFDCNVSNIVRWSVLPTSKAKMSKRFRGLSDEELLVSVFDVVLRKKLQRNR